jgi:hypothetical protein
MKWRRRNLLGLSRHDPGLAQSLAENPPTDPSLELLRGPSGAWTARRTDAKGRKGFVHSSMAPLDQARRVIAACLPASFREDRAPQGAVCLLLGIGLGWPALAAAELIPEGVGLWLADSSPDAFSKGLDCLDLSGLWDRRRLRLMFGAPLPSLVHRLAGAGPGAWTVAVTDSVLDSDPVGRTWALDWLRVLGEIKAPPQAEADGLPDWLLQVGLNLTRGDLA